MSLHKLTAGGGYDYLTRQVAAHDSTELGSSTGLASYYTERGETPGQWIGTGMAGLDGLAAGEIVTADQMHALFGLGIHPLAEERRAALEQSGVAPSQAEQDTRLGLPFKVHVGDVSDFRIKVARALTDYNVDRGFPRDHAVPVDERARIRTEIGTDFFREENGRAPQDARELAASIAKHSRPKTTAVAGYDLTFSPVKSVSSLWAVADPSLAARIELAHQAAIKDALEFIETHALYSRTGAGGIRQVDVQGLVATAFTHRDSRAGDPDLHTHVAIANKVRSREGQWLSIDGRVLYKANVAASETYNTALERHLTKDLGVRFAERANPDPRKRPVREIIGIDPDLNQRWSARRVSIQARRAELARDFQTTHGRPPSPVESIKLAQQATLETRDAKHEPRTLAEQRLLWRGQAREVLGSEEAIQSMVARSIETASGTSTRVNRKWVNDTSVQIRNAMQSRRSTWQTWHVRAEALRKVRELDGLAPEQVEKVVQRLTERVLERDSVLLTQDHDPVSEPAALTRANGESVYSVHGSSHYTSTDVLAAEQRIVVASARQSGRTIDATHVDHALLESTANGVTLNAGQSSLVREMATSPAAVQLAIAPAGAGKTTAMRALSNAWSNGGGQVLGLAPSAAAAAVLGEQIDVATDTLAKLVWSLENDPANLPEWAQAVDRSTLLVIDEAGMADTLSLDSVITFALERGAKVRLIGDDQQLAAIGAGGVLRDIEATHGALRLNELMRFRTPGEGAASLAMRDGRPEALGFYLDHQRVHVGDLSTMTDEVFDSWRSDRGDGRDSIMLAPTRDLVAQLNERARAHRLEGAEAGASVRLSDGLEASVGDQVITRSNNRRLRVSPTDWVKNGDRWQVVDVHDSGAMTVQHLRHQRMVTLPADYVAQATELGFASTVHGAQGVSVDASHALVTDQISRQSLYTALTRGAQENHVYLEVVGDGDEHNIIRPETIRPETATDLLEGILARDDSPVSASTQMRLDADPARLLGDAVSRYSDALYFAAENLMGPTAVAELEKCADEVMPGVSAQPAWPALRAHLILLSAQGADPIADLQQAMKLRSLDGAVDPAAVLDWRLDASGHRGAGAGPLPWLPAVPRSLREHSTWGDYLAARSDLVADTAARVHADSDTQPPWARELGAQLSPAVLGDVTVWRAATRVDAQDLRPTGQSSLQKAAFNWQKSLDRRITGTHEAALEHWGQLLGEHVGNDPRFLPVLAARLAAISRAGVDAPAVLRRALGEGTLPDDHAASALWWRINAHLSPATAAALANDHALRSSWQDRLPDLVGARQAIAIQSSPMWPHLVTAVDRGLQIGWTLETLLDTSHVDVPDADLAQALTWRISSLTDPVPTPEEDSPPDPMDQSPEDLWHQAPTDPVQSTPDEPVEDLPDLGPPDPMDEPPTDLWHGDPVDPASGGVVDVDEHEPAPEVEAAAAASEQDIETGIALAAMRRPLMLELEPSSREVEQQIRWALEADTSAVPPERLAEVNAMTWQFFQSRLPDGWVPEHLNDRFGPHASSVDAGYAPNAWTALVEHLHGRGVTDQEMEISGVATRARTGSLIDRFRDRAVFPIEHHGDVLGFVGRRHPDVGDDDRKGPKYLNTGDTPLFHKGAQLFVANPQLLSEGATSVLVEGPMDAIAVTLAGQGRYVGVAPLGTSLTLEQATQLARTEVTPVVATDADLAGRVAAERAYWMLAQHNLDPWTVVLPEGADPADVLREGGADVLATHLDERQALGSVLVDERLANLEPPAALPAAAQVLAARDPAAWEHGLSQIGHRLQLSTLATRRAFYGQLSQWEQDPAAQAQQRLGEAQEVKGRLQQAADASPTERWAGLARSIDPRLVEQSDWPALANMLEHAAEQGHDVASAVREVAPNDDPLGIQPAQDLRYRLAAHLPERPTGACPSPLSPSRGAQLDRKAGTPPGHTPRRGVDRPR